MSVFVDHLVVGAATLDQGVAWCEATLGVTPGPGGQHALMGTHNRLLKIATAGFVDAYLEVIAIDPDEPPPARVRWFGLDGAALQSVLRRGPKLLHLVARSTMLDMHRWGLITLGHAPGDPVAASRDTPAGRLSWQMLLRDDGRLLLAGALPTLIQWQGPHPAHAMPGSGVRLSALTLQGVPERVRDLLRLRGAQVLATAGPALTATLDTPLGIVVLSSHFPQDAP